MKTASLFFVATLVSLSACAPDTAPAMVVEESVNAPFDAAVTQGHVSGEIGPEAIDAPTTSMHLYDDGEYLSIKLVLVEEGRAVMALLSATTSSSTSGEATAGHGLFNAGESASFVFGDVDNDMHVTLLGCVGEEEGIYGVYDKPADELDIDVVAGDSDQPGALDVMMAARWYERDELGAVTAAHHDAEIAFVVTR